MELNDEKLNVRKLTQADAPGFSALIHLFNMVFEEDESAIGSEMNVLQLLRNHNFLAIAAFYENEIVGGLTAYELPMYYSDHSELLLYDLAVHPAYQRMGIGKRLIQSLKEYCATNGIREFFVLAHEEDEHALAFYHSTGGKSEKVVNFLYEGTITNEKGKGRSGSV